MSKANFSLILGPAEMMLQVLAERRCALYERVAPGAVVGEFGSGCLHRRRETPADKFGKTPGRYEYKNADFRYHNPNISIIQGRFNYEVRYYGKYGAA